MKYRIEQESDTEFYPQYKYSWWPFWFYFEKRENYRWFFGNKADAMIFIANHIKGQDKKYPIYHDYE